MKYLVEIELSAAHRLPKGRGFGKCEGLHGHNWIAKIKIDSPFVNFTDLKRKIKEILSDMDHCTFVSNEDNALKSSASLLGPMFLVNGSTICENIAPIIAQKVGKFYRVVSVELQESKNNVCLYEMK